MKNIWRILLILLAVVSFGIALSYPIRYRLEADSTENNMERLLALKDAGRVSESEATPEVDPGAEPPEAAEGEAEPEEITAEQAAAEPQAQEPVAERAISAPANGDAAEEFSDATQTNNPAAEYADAAGLDAPEVASKPDRIVSEANEEPVTEEEPEANEEPNATGKAKAAVTPKSALEVTPSPEPTPTPVPTPTINRFERSNAALPYPDLEKVELDESKILPQYQEIYALNPDFVGWIAIPGMNVDYPVVQTEDSEFYLEHDFFGDKNANGQIILDTKCDPYTPSYNLVISGHNMRSGKMFGNLVNYMYKSFWEKHKLLQFDTLMEENTYVIFAAFFSADYDVDEEGFRYNADIQYPQDAKSWLREIKENQVYDTEIDVGFGDEFLTLTTCNKSRRKDGRFVLVCRKVREGEEF